jgi:TRAP-type C4-dicarboxylate transport system permease small subunit
MNALKKTIGTIYQKLSPVTSVANAIGMIALATMMFVTALDVLGRKLLNMPILGSYEMIELLMAICIGLGLAHCGIMRGHINIDIITMHLSKRANAILGIFTGFIAFVIIGIASWQACVYIVNKINTKAVTTVLYIPIYPFVAIVALGLIMYFIVLIVHWLEFIQQAAAKEGSEK